MQKIAVLVVLLLCWTFYAVSAWATIVSISDLSKRIDSNYSGVNSYAVILRFDDNDPSLRIWQQDDFWRQEWVLDSGDTQEVVAVAVGRGRSALLSMGYEHAGPPATMILFEGFSWWLEKGLNPELQSYHFYHGRPALALGMSVARDPRPHIWLDNEEMVPLRMLFFDSGAYFDLGWLEHKNVGNYKLPHRMLLSSGDMELECSLEWRGINTQYDSSLFSPEILDQSFSRIELTPPDLVGDYYSLLPAVY